MEVETSSLDAFVDSSSFDFKVQFAFKDDMQKEEYFFIEEYRSLEVHCSLSYYSQAYYAWAKAIASFEVAYFKEFKIASEMVIITITIIMMIIVIKQFIINFAQEHWESFIVIENLTSLECWDLAFAFVDEFISFAKLEVGIKIIIITMGFKSQSLNLG